MQIFVFTNPELGWDCVVGALKNTGQTEEEALREFYETNYGEELTDIDDCSVIVHTETLY